MPMSENNNVQRSAGSELAKVNVAWRPNNTGSALNAFAPGNTVRSLTRTGVGTWLVIFRAGIMTAPFTNNTIFSRTADVSNANAAAARATVVSLSIVNGELNVAVATVDGAGAAVELAANANRWISLELQAELNGAPVPPETL